MDYKPKQLKFEDYISFCHDPHANRLTCSQLNQILFLHGFVKLTSHTKEDAMNAVCSLDLVIPTRSTISTCIYCPLSPLSLVEVQLDTREIGWEECPIGTVTSFNPKNYCAASDSSRTFSVVSELTQICTKKENTVRKRKKLDNAAGLVAEPLAVKRTMRIPVIRLSEHDVYSWRVNGTKKKENIAYRWYYRCRTKTCPVRKTVSADSDDPSMCIVTYTGEHNHDPP